MNRKAMVVLADGCEEIEAVTPIDVLRRAGVEVIVAGLKAKSVVGARGIQLGADILLSECRELPDALILPGGGAGAKHLGESKELAQLIQTMHQKNKIVAAICASPAFVLAPAGILEGKKATCFPGCEKQFPKSTVFLQERVVVDGNIITSRGPGTALEFALTLVEQLVGKGEAKKLQEVMAVKNGL